MAEGIRDCDVVITAALQNERMNGALLHSDRANSSVLRLTARAPRAKPDAIVMHPGPITAAWDRLPGRRRQT